MIFILYVLLHVNIFFADADIEQTIDTVDAIRSEHAKTVNNTISETIAIESNQSGEKQQEHAPFKAHVSDTHTPDQYIHLTVNSKDDNPKTNTTKDDNQKQEDNGNENENKEDEEDDDSDDDNNNESTIPSSQTREEKEEQDNLEQTMTILDTLPHEQIAQNSRSTDTQKNSLTIHTTNSSITKNVSSKKITVINTITPEKTAYTHWTGTYTPEFTVTVNQEPIDMSCKKTVELSSEQTMSIAYHAQFPAQRSSEDTMTITLNEHINTISVDFDWHKTPRLLINQS